MAGLLGSEDQYGGGYGAPSQPQTIPATPMGRSGGILPNNVSIKELLDFLFKKGLLGPAKDALTPVDPINNQSMEQTMQTRQRQLQQLGL